MPDPPVNPKIVRPLPQPSKNAAPIPLSQSYAELRCKTNFSFLEGASHPDELVQRASELGYAALAVTDRNTLAGVVRAHVAAKAAGLKLLIGSEIAPLDASPLVLLAMNRAGYGRLSKLITLGRRNAPKGECQLTAKDVAEHAEGLIACVISSSKPTDSTSHWNFYRDAFGDRTYLLAQMHYGSDDRRQLHRLASLTTLPLAACNDVHYHVPSRQLLQDVLTAVRCHCTVAELGHRRFPNAQRHLKSPQQMRKLFASCPEAVERTLEIAARCEFSLEELRYEYPHELCPPGKTPAEHLAELTWQGARDRYPQGVPIEVRATIERELALIHKLRYEPFFSHRLGYSAIRPRTKDPLPKGAVPRRIP